MRFLLFVAGLALAHAPAGAQPDSLRRHLEAANEAYAQGRYERAARGYRRILEAGHESGVLYHNLGNAYVRLGRVGPAVWAYERGRRLRPDDPRLRHNLEFVRRREGLSLGGLPPRGLAALVAGWSPLVLFGIGVLLLGVGGGVAVVRAGPDQSIAWRSVEGGGAVVAGLLLVAVAFGTSYVQAHDRRAVVIPRQASLRTAPEDGAAPDSTLKAGAMVEVQGRQAGWVRVRLGDGSVGWISASALREV